MSEFLKTQYPNSIYMIDEDFSMDKMIKIYKNLSIELYQKEREKYLKEHSKEKFLSIFSKI